MVQGNSTLLRGAPDPVGCPCPTVDEAALRYLRHFHGAIRWCIHGYAIPEHDRPLVTQDVAVKLLLRFRRHGALPPEGPSTYIVTIARNCCSDYWRQAHRAQPATDDADAHPTTDMPLAEWLERSDAHQRLRLAVATLPPLSREAMRRVLLGHNLAEIARHFDVSIGTVKSITHRARLLLRKRLVR